MAWFVRSRACLAEPPAEFALDDEQFGALRARVRTIRELTRKPQLAAGILARNVLFGPPSQPLFGPLDREIEQFERRGRRGREPVIEAVAQGRLDHPRRLLAHQPALVLTLEFRIAKEDRNQGGAGANGVLAGQDRGALGLADALGMVLQTAQKGGAQPCLMRAAVGGGDRVAIGMDEAVVLHEPGDRPFERAMPARLLDPAGKALFDDEGFALDILGEIVLKAAGKVEGGLGWNFASGIEQFRVAMPAYLDAAEEIGFGARHAEQPGRLELRALAENLLIRLESHLGAAPVRDAADLSKLALWRAPLEELTIEDLAARDLDFEPLGERIDHGYADAMQAARCLVRAGIEFSAGVQHRHDYFERRFLGKLRMRIDRNATAVVGDTEKAVGLEGDVDERRVTRDRLIHRIVEDFGEEVMQRRLVGTADIHAGAPADRLEPFENLDRGGGITGFSRRAAAARAIGSSGYLFARRIAEKVAVIGHSKLAFSILIRRPQFSLRAYPAYRELLNGAPGWFGG